MATKSNIILIDVISDEQLQPNQQLVIAFEALLKDDHHKLSEFAQNYYSSTLKLTPQGNFIPDLSSLHNQHRMMRETLPSLRKNCSAMLDCLDTYKKLSAVIFAGAASITAAVIAANSSHAKMAPVAGVGAGAAFLLVELRKWIHSLLEKREADVKKLKEITYHMNIGAGDAINDLDAIIAFLSENGGSRKKRAAIREKLLRDYNDNMKRTKEKVNRVLGLL
ncbi:hypothetical protein SASPL_103021 [Salvia splendens]|uniref:Uncharacterized protein n=1 Tax=Salvia splendens TaxID=180675 RepID=A0A8X8YUW2_SALSN|nr:hypothetical protein SASPL_103021 [Salvia splendens]